ncbi:hypothetical protein [Teredinibacter sp. KSP-S5-2]|uniref:hypothetical protein n=1 Tax=Teredinibacter sp. KSP-S5-2 TaxID=3034506 RepID=UPI00293419FA|nr:hypothetical protein [Teredinibacter sp. KSP-S5-2]WNO10308.1 hypothetical protein P5V12_03890 [Teredinibacter sp. KSP-S5-2]
MTIVKNRFILLGVLLLSSCSYASDSSCKNKLVDSTDVACVSEYMTYSTFDVESLIPVVEDGISGNTQCDRWDWVYLSYELSKKEGYTLNYDFVEEFALEGVEFAKYLMVNRSLETLSKEELSSVLYWSLVYSLDKPQNTKLLGDLSEKRELIYSKVTKNEVLDVVRKVVNDYYYMKTNPCK